MENITNIYVFVCVANTYIYKKLIFSDKNRQFATSTNNEILCFMLDFNLLFNNWDKFKSYNSIELHFVYLKIFLCLFCNFLNKYKILKAMKILCPFLLQNLILHIIYY